MIKIISGKLEYIDRKETLRYLGGAKGGNAEDLRELLDECEKIMLKAQSLKACYKSFPISFTGGDNIDLGFAKVTSHSLKLNLTGCDKIVLFASTLGSAVDREIIKYEKISPARGAVLQGMGAAAAEQWCDIIDDTITAEYGAGKPRFSCGYGDLSITLQRDIFAALSVTKNLGITLSDSCFMVPTKSVTAIKGIIYSCPPLEGRGRGEV